jgi:hypothetical protein
MFAMSFKFFPKDVIGCQPKKIGDRFTARLMGGVAKFEVEELRGEIIMAVLVED